MRIKDFETYVLGTPWRNLTYLVLELADGTRGVGEARVIGKTHTVVEYLKDVRRHIVGHDVHDIEDLYRRFTLLDFGWGCSGLGSIRPRLLWLGSAGGPRLGSERRRRFRPQPLG